MVDNSAICCVLFVTDDHRLTVSVNLSFKTLIFFIDFFFKKIKVKTT